MRYVFILMVQVFTLCIRDLNLSGHFLYYLVNARSSLV